MVRKGECFFRLGLEVENVMKPALTRTITFERGKGVRTDTGGGPTWMGGGFLRVFSPDDLQLVKGAPAQRRRFLDDTIARRVPSYRRAVLDYRKVLSQRNNFLQRARSGLVSIADIRPWDRQLASLAVRICTARMDMCTELQPHFNRAYNDITGEREFLEVRLVSQVTADEDDRTREAALLNRLEGERRADMESARTGTGSHKDDIEFVLDGRSMRRYGSQGEQRTAVLALLLADRELALARGERAPVLLLDDVMSELDQGRRRRLMSLLMRPGGQAIITAADRGLFSREELEGAAVMEVCRGAVLESWAGSNV